MMKARLGWAGLGWFRTAGMAAIIDDHQHGVQD
jgi:hypothetical protein